MFVISKTFLYIVWDLKIHFYSNNPDIQTIVY